MKQTSTSPHLPPPHLPTFYLYPTQESRGAAQNKNVLPHSKSKQHSSAGVKDLPQSISSITTAMSSKSRPERSIEIEERDQAHNLVATYIRSSEGGAYEKSRFDVVVCILYIFFLCVFCFVLVFEGIRVLIF